MITGHRIPCTPWQKDHRVSCITWQTARTTSKRHMEVDTSKVGADPLERCHVARTCRIDVHLGSSLGSLGRHSRSHLIWPAPQNQQQEVRDTRKPQAGQFCSFRSFSSHLLLQGADHEQEQRGEEKLCDRHTPPARRCQTDISLPILGGQYWQETSIMTTPCSKKGKLRTFVHGHLQPAAPCSPPCVAQ